MPSGEYQKDLFPWPTYELFVEQSEKNEIFDIFEMLLFGDCSWTESIRLLLDKNRTNT